MFMQGLPGLGEKNSSGFGITINLMFGYQTVMLRIVVSDTMYCQLAAEKYIRSIVNTASVPVAL